MSKDKDDGWEDALSRPDDPWSSREVEEVLVRPDLLTEIWEWMRSPAVRACGKACGYASDFEITEAMKPFFPEVYEGMIRRQMRILRKRHRRIITVPKEAHRHFNPDTRRYAQCHYIQRVRLIPRQR